METLDLDYFKSLMWMLENDISDDTWLAKEMRLLSGAKELLSVALMLSILGMDPPNKFV